MTLLQFYSMLHLLAVITLAGRNVIYEPDFNAGYDGS